MSDLVAFLRARLDEFDEEIRRRLAIPPGWAHDGPCVNYEGQDPADRDMYDSCSRHVAAAEAKRADRFPYRDLEFGRREVAAKRAIVEECESTMAWVQELRREGRPGDAYARHVGSLLGVLKTFAEVWRDHSDYDPSWSIDG